MVIPSENEIKNILSNKDMLLKSLNTRRLTIYKELQDQEALIQVNLRYGFNGSGTEHVQTSRVHDVMDDMLSYHRRRRKYEKEMNKLLAEITEIEERIYKVWYCFTRLPEPFYTYLYELYVEKRPYKDVLSRSGLANSSFAKKRLQAIKTLQMFYDYNALRDMKGNEDKSDV